jgi:NAD-specific glutamate dehydrogenase
MLFGRNLQGVMTDEGWTDEILLSSDKTVAIIDGSGVLADFNGINREELIRLAHLRVPVSHFDKSKLTKDGYLVRIEDQDVKLPCECSFVSDTVHIVIFDDPS